MNRPALICKPLVGGSSPTAGTPLTMSGGRADGRVPSAMLRLSAERTDSGDPNEDLLMVDQDHHRVAIGNLHQLGIFSETWFVRCLLCLAKGT